MSKKYFFSFGDEKYQKSKDRIKQEAINSGLFDDIQVYGPEDISEEFKQKVSPYWEMPRGFGYWLWKSFLLKKTFDEMEEGDYCVYADAGCTVNPNGKPRFEHYLSLLDNDETQSGIFRYVFGNTAEKLFTNQKIFETLGKGEDLEFQNSDCLMATIMYFKKTEHSIKYVDKLMEITLEHPEIFSDEFNNYKRIPEFKDNRHDQSVTSCLVKIMGKAVIFDDETYAPDMQGWENLFYNVRVPILATRIRN